MQFMLYNNALHKITTQALNLATATLKAHLIMDHVAVGGGAVDISTEPEADSLAELNGGNGIASLIFDGANYAIKTLASVAISRDETNHLVKVDAADLAYASLGEGAANVTGILIYVHVDGTAANDYPLALLPQSPAVSPDGGTLNIVFDAAGLFDLKKAA